MATTPVSQIPWAQPDFWGSEEKYLLEALHSSWISGGPFVNRLESIFAEYTGSKHAISASNGTTALHMAFLALGIGPGDEVVVPGFSFLATANVALHVGATPVFSEVDPQSWCATASDFERCITPKTKAIIPVHTYGNVCDMDDIVSLAKSKRIAVLEDTAEAFASRYKGKLAGTMSDIGSFSFQATKTITTGEGGMVVTDDDELFRIMTLYRNHGVSGKRYWHEVPGHNFRLTNIQAALGVAQFEKLDSIVSARHRVHATYSSLLSGVEGIVLQRFSDDVDPVLWAIAATLDPSAYPQGRDAVMEQMADAGFETRNGFYAPSLMPLYKSEPLPVCESLSASVISLPTYPSLSDADIERICQTLISLREKQ